MQPTLSDGEWTADEEDDRPRTAPAIGLATVGAFVGFAAVFAYALALQGGPNGPGFDDRMFLHHNAGLLPPSLLGGGTGCFIGAVVGWFVSRPAIEPSKARTGGLRATALTVVLVGFASLAVGSAASEGADGLTLQ